MIFVSHFPDFSYTKWATMKGTSMAYVLNSSWRNYFIEVFGKSSQLIVHNQPVN